MAANYLPFAPNATHSKTISVTASSSSVTLDATDVSQVDAANGQTIGGHQAIRIANAGTKVAFLRYGVGAQTATVNDMALLPGQTGVFSKAVNMDTVAAICGGSDSTTLYLTCGEGI